MQLYFLKTGKKISFGGQHFRPTLKQISGDAVASADTQLRCFGENNSKIFFGMLFFILPLCMIKFFCSIVKNN